MAITYDDLWRRLKESSRRRYDEGESRWIARMALQGLTDLSHTDLLLKGSDEASESLMQRVEEVCKRIESGEPVQYVLGFEEFMGMKIGVDRRVLIPRRETEQLVQLIVDREKGREDLSVADLCTGSGCIAIALSRWLPFSRVTGVDKSAAALDVARDNAAHLKARITLREADILDPEFSLGEKADIIVSNPPYVMESERAAMSRNVLDYEPGMALFVSDADPTVFYDAIARIGRRDLKPCGRLYFELNPLTADRIDLRGYHDVEVLEDSNRHRRLLRAVRDAD